MNNDNPNFREDCLPNAQARESINKFLTFKMGNCWHHSSNEVHSYFGITHICFCGKTWDEEDDIPNFDLLTWDGFGKLLVWAKDQDWWYQYERDNLIMECEPDWGDGEYSFPQYLVNPEEFAVSLFRFIKENKL